MSETDVSHAGRRADRTPVIEVDSVSKRFALADSLLDRLAGTQTFVRAVTDVSLSVYEGETLGLVGESGSGKSTLANVIAGLYTPTSGEVRFDGVPVGHATTRPTELLEDVGMVFQNPRASLNPRMSVEDIIAEPLRSQGWDEQRREARVEELIDLVDLSEIHRGRYPHELSGGQAQRVAIARAVALNPRVLILDEPVSALDVSVQAKILNLLIDLQSDLGLTYLLIAHDLSVVEHMADRIAVMYLGRIMEVATPEGIFENPTHPYTEALLSAIPSVDPRGKTEERIILEGDVPSPVNPPSGCVFHTRCPVVIPPEDWPGDQPAFEAAFAFRNQVLSGDIDPAAVRRRLHARAEPPDGERTTGGIDEEADTPLERLLAAAVRIRTRVSAAAGRLRHRLVAAVGKLRSQASEVVVTFREHVLSGPIDRQSVREWRQALRESSDDDAVARRIVEEALPGDVGDLPDEAAQRIEEAAEAIAVGDEDRAREIVREAFPSPCERQVPRFVETESGHTVACHRSDADVLGEPVDVEREYNRG